MILICVKLKCQFMEVVKSVVRIWGVQFPDRASELI